MKYSFLAILLFLFATNIFAEVPVITTSSVEDARFKAQDVFDGDFSTRWSSSFSDNQWLQFDFRSQKKIAGVLLFWEQAFSSEYSIEYSDDARNWNVAYVNLKGDGNSDEIYFSETSARFWRIFCKKRATAWGNSLREVSFINGKDVPYVISHKDKAIKNIFDGNLKNEWLAKINGQSELVFAFDKLRQLGGLVIYWGDKAPINRSIYFSIDNKSWRKVYGRVKKPVKEEHIYLSGAEAKYIKIIADTKDFPLSIKEIMIRREDERLSPERLFKVLERQSQKGLYPRWLSDEQSFWTVSGTPFGVNEVALSEEGIVEPKHFSPIVFPLIKINEDIFTYADVGLRQGFLGDDLPMPFVEWTAEKFIFRIELFVDGGTDNEKAYLKYSVKNISDDVLDGSFLLSIRPFQLNPPWMHGGIAAIKNITYLPGEKKLLVNKKNFLKVGQEPFRFFAADFSNDGDILGQLSNLENAPLTVLDKQSLASGMLEYKFSIPENKTSTWYFCLALSSKAGFQSKDVSPVFFEKNQAKVIKAWSAIYNKIPFKINDEKLMRAVKTNLAYILIAADRNMLKPGCRNYDCSWMRDGAVMGKALLKFGFHDKVKSYLQEISSYIGNNGWVPFIIDNEGIPVTHGWKEFDSQGEYLYLLAEYLRHTGDIEFIKTKKETIKNVVEFVFNERAKRKTEEFTVGDKLAFYGLLPESASHEGYIDPPRHSYWDDFWCLRGLSDAEYLFRKINMDNYADSIKKEADDFSKDLVSSIENVIQQKKISFIPGAAELGDFDPSATAIAVWPCSIDDLLPSKQFKHTFRKYWYDVFLQRLNNGWQGAFAPYEFRIANYWIDNGDKEKLGVFLNDVCSYMRPEAWGHWAEVILSDKRLNQYVGDMPHAWIGALFINAVSNALVWEESDKNYYGKGLLSVWLEKSAKVSVEKMSTIHGNVSYAAYLDAEGKIIFEQ